MQRFTRCRPSPTNGNHSPHRLTRSRIDVAENSNIFQQSSTAQPSLSHLPKDTAQLLSDGHQGLEETLILLQDVYGPYNTTFRRPASTSQVSTRLQTTKTETKDRSPDSAEIGLEIHRLPAQRGCMGVCRRISESNHLPRSGVSCTAFRSGH